MNKLCGGCNYHNFPYKARFPVMESGVYPMKEFNSFDENARWSDNLFGNKVASIPLTVIDALNKKGILRGFKVLDEKAFRQFLNDPDNRFFRTRTGRI